MAEDMTVEKDENLSSNKITVKTTGPFELRDPIANIDINENEQEVVETSFVSQMLGLGRLTKTAGKVTQEWDPNESNQNPAVDVVLPTRDDNETVADLNEKAATSNRGRPKKA
jgi:hypothetical protein